MVGEPAHDGRRGCLRQIPTTNNNPEPTTIAMGSISYTITMSAFSKWGIYLILEVILSCYHKKIEEANMIANMIPNMIANMIPNMIANMIPNMIPNMIANMYRNPMISIIKKLTLKYSRSESGLAMLLAMG